MSNDYVHQVAKQSGSNFYISFFSLPKAQREAITAVYAFCREVDDAVDDPKGDPERAVAQWREEINSTYDGKPTLPLTRSLHPAIEQFQLARKAADADFYVLSEVDARLRQLTQQMKEQREDMIRAGKRPPPEQKER